MERKGKHFLGTWGFWFFRGSQGFGREKKTKLDNSFPFSDFSFSFFGQILIQKGSNNAHIGKKKVVEGKKKKLVLG